MKLSSSPTTKPTSFNHRIVSPNAIHPRSATSVPASLVGLAALAAIPSAQSPRRAILLRPRTLLVYWHLLSLDAPTVAMLWTWFIAKTSGVQLPPTSVLAMGAAVWILYAADRLLDSHRGTRRKAPHPSTHEGLKDFDAVKAARAADTFPPRTHARPNPGNHNLEPRHLFHRLHHRAFLTGIAVASFALVVLIHRLPSQSLHLYTVLGTLLAAYFALIHRKHGLAARMPKEIAVGIFFSAATFIPTVARNPALRGPLFPAALLLGLICTLNCLFIYIWEHPAPFAEAHPATRLALILLQPLAGLGILASFVLALRTTQWQLPCAVATATVLLLLLHNNRRHLDPTTLRAAADLCLLTPIAFALNLK